MLLLQALASFITDPAVALHAMSALPRSIGPTSAPDLAASGCREITLICR
jgi:hypothetical protein